MAKTQTELTLDYLTQLTEDHGLQAPRYEPRVGDVLVEERTITTFQVFVPSAYPRGTPEPILVERDEESESFHFPNMSLGPANTRALIAFLRELPEEPEDDDRG